MTTYSSGPWFVEYDDANGQAVVCSNGLEVATCWHHCVGSIEKEMRANARLIAAAPELLEALQYLVSLGGCDCLDPARAAIAKALGND